MRYRFAMNSGFTPPYFVNQSLSHAYINDEKSKLGLEQWCATGGPWATTRPAESFTMALVKTLIFPHHA